MWHKNSNEARLAIFNSKLHYLFKKSLIKIISFLPNANSSFDFIPMKTDCISPLTLQSQGGQCSTQGEKVVTL